MSPALWGARFEGRVTMIAEALERNDPRPLLARQAEGQELEERARDLLARNDPHALAAAIRSFKAMTVTDAEIAALAVPLLVIVGTDDLPQSRIDAFGGHRGLEVVTIEGATHGGARGTLRQPAFLDALRRFLQRHAGAA